MLKYRVQYHDIGAQAYETKQRERELVHLRRKAAKLGFTLSPRELHPQPAACLAAT